MILRSPATAFLGFRLLSATSLAILTAIPATVNASTLMPSSDSHSGYSISQSNNTVQWLIADKDRKDDKDDKKERDDERGRRRNRDRDDDEGERRIDIHRGMNFARQAAEKANGGLRVYRAESSMYGAAEQSPCVDNGDSWTWTFLGGRPGASTMTVETVVTIYKSSSQIVVNYNGPVRNARNRVSTTTTTNTTTTTTGTSTVSGRQTVTLTNGYRITFRGVTYSSNTSTWRYYVEELPVAQDLSNWVLGLPTCSQIVAASPKGEFVNLDPNARIRGIKWQPGGGFVKGEFSVTLNGRWAVGSTTVAVKGPDVARGELAGPSCSRI